MSLTPQNRRDLERFRDYLRAIPRRRYKKFDMSHWAECNTADKFVYGEFSERDLLRELREPSCNTSACALGYACSMPQFRRRGLRLHVEDDGTGYPVYGTEEGTWAGCAFFGIEHEAAAWLFDPIYYMTPTPDITPKMVAKRIDYLLKHDGATPLPEEKGFTSYACRLR